MKQTAFTACVASASMSSTFIQAFSPSGPTQLQPSSRQFSRSNDRATSLNLYLDPTASIIDPTHVLAQTSTILATIDSDIASIPDDQFGKVFAGGIGIMFGSILSTIFVGFLLESNGGGYADVVAESYAGQNFEDEGETFFDSLGLTPGQKKETEDMVRTFREKKMKKAGTWTEDNEKEKQQLLEEKDMFSDYD